MPTKRGQNTRSNAQPSKRRKQERNATPITATDIQALSEQITQTVTASVIATLQQSGIIPNPQPDNDAKRKQETMTSPLEKETSTSPLGSAQRGAESSSTSSSAAYLSNNENKFVSSRIPLCATVSLKKKEKIWSGEFIDLSALQDDDVEDLTINVRTGAVSTTTASKKKFMSIEQWTDAFNVFSSVYRIKYPAEAEGLSTYMGLIGQISDRNGNWYYYDTNFDVSKPRCNFAGLISSMNFSLSQ